MSSGETALRPIDEELLLLTAYLLSSGRGLLEEPQQYGPFRCIDAARRVLVLLRDRGVTNSELQELHGRLEDFMCGPMAPRDLTAFLDEVCGKLTLLLRDSDLIRRGPASPATT
ncbi:DUF6092 family protein [Streptomyces uncialis]|uniref:AlbB n=1 Tax=Streptomyces uncialis TaxID=1048205 RepID=A0A1Q4UXD0_9ACTN|nr:DUF6092 family protein [Streptomyces uncialis]MCX4662198.1 DUF6092 family protein [Streptomyces uncialis]OKH90242.1 hypothetical protein AB852_35825 [Streptomyces uncialis]WST71862.1 DUF6092 family protein [Streptomyces uncialis]WTE09454.1 DUF6092 family protein [Streptomyces uncialis]